MRLTHYRLLPLANLKVLPLTGTAVCQYIDVSTCCTGHVGVPTPNVMIKLVDVEEMKYFAANNEGEVL